jgi:hypothetical protein
VTVSSSARIRSRARDIADLPRHRVDAEHPARTVCGEPVAQTAPEAWEDVPLGERCPRCELGTG